MASGFDHSQRQVIELEAVFIEEIVKSKENNDALSPQGPMGVGERIVGRRFPIRNLDKGASFQRQDYRLE